MSCLTTDNLEEIKALCEDTIKDSDCVYKLCHETYLIIMKKLPDTITNENRNNVLDINYAKFRANKLRVILILNIFDLSDYPSSIQNHYRFFKTVYNVNEIVKPLRFEKDINKVCAHGIHYFNTIDAAYYYRNMPCLYTGHWQQWYDNGIKSYDCYCNKGKNIGRAIEWYENGRKKSEYFFDENILANNVRHWYSNGQPMNLKRI